MSACLRRCFKQAIANIDAQLSDKGEKADIVLLDGVAMGLCDREVNVVKGDSKSAAIAAASNVAKTTRDAIMEDLDDSFPGYGFASNKGYGSSEHIDAIRRKGATSEHRLTFCRSFIGENNEND